MADRATIARAALLQQHREHPVPHIGARVARIDAVRRRQTVLSIEIGDEAAAVVIAEAGGERLHVPGQIANAGRLRDRFGEAVAHLLVTRLGDTRFYVPVPAPSAPLDLKAVARMDGEHKSATQIARSLGCSIRAVHKARAKNRMQGA